MTFAVLPKCGDCDSEVVKKVPGLWSLEQMSCEKVQLGENKIATSEEQSWYHSCIFELYNFYLLHNCKAYVYEDIKTQNIRISALTFKINEISVFWTVNAKTSRIISHLIIYFRSFSVWYAKSVTVMCVSYLPWHLGYQPLSPSWSLDFLSSQSLYYLVGREVSVLLFVHIFMFIN